MRVKAVLLASAFLVTAICAAQDESATHSLKGIRAIAVMVDIPDKVTKGISDLNADQLKADVELRLRKNGIRVVPVDDPAPPRGIAYLSVRVNATTTTVGCFSIYLGLIQGVKLFRDDSIVVPAITWRSGPAVGDFGDAGVRFIRDNLGDSVDRFSNDFLSVNPSKK